ncbi:hypothetical protein EMA8858_04164 [Emticicia aquatica]|uniref:Uncharacterized protein n=1 Tax=Emticicia aquatica TaxID=1681835 RepID=A0ABN8F0Z8_9BACT|nr:hypothetical protein EMA8858_04164 [Emticicia aquatica]
MVKTYIVVFSFEYDIELVKPFLNESSDIEFWFQNLPSSLFINTKLSANDLYTLISNKFGQHKIFITPVKNYFGRLPKDHWQHFKNK